MRYTAVATMVTVLIALTLAPVAADIVTTNLDANADAYVSSYFDTANTADSSLLDAGRNPTFDDRRRSLINFDTTGNVPEGNSVEEVILHLTTYSWQTDDDEASNIAMFQVDGSWSEEEVTWNSMPSVGSQIGDTTYEVTGDAPDELTWDVTSVWAESTNLDFYMAMTNPETGGGMFAAYSSEGTTAPYLEITYGDNAVPEPCTLALVGLGLGGLLLRRRETA